jgi:hypothetical protein
MAKANMYQMLAVPVFFEARAEMASALEKLDALRGLQDQPDPLEQGWLNSVCNGLELSLENLRNGPQPEPADYCAECGWHPSMSVRPHSETGCPLVQPENGAR